MTVRLRAALFAALTLCVAGPLYAADDAKEAELAARAEAADAFLADDSFYKKWTAKGAISSPEVAETVKETAQGEIDRLKAALADKRAWCSTRFFVNACLDEARKRSFTREREFRHVIVEADAVIRAERTRRIQARRAETRAQTHEPLDVERAAVREPSNPIGIAPAQPRKEHAPLEIGAKTPRKASEPVGEHIGMSSEDVKKRSEAAAERAAQEDANLAAYEKKQAEARERLKNAEETAAKRRAEREKREAEFNKTLKERTDAQKRYEARQGERDSGLAKYF